MPKGKPPVHPTESELRGALDVLRQEREAARPRLRQLLAAGRDTTALRGELVALERRIEDITAALAGLTAERERKEAAITSADADGLATDALHRLEATLAGLQPPQHPSIQEFKP
jgi:DNA repair exonuclease SbcCD ATPase subunit